MAEKNLWKSMKNKKIPWRQFNMSSLKYGIWNMEKSITIWKKCYALSLCPTCNPWPNPTRRLQQDRWGQTYQRRIFEHLWKQENCHWGEFLQNCPSRKWLIQYGEHNMWNISPSMAIHEQKVIQTLVPNVQTMAKSKRNESTRKAKDKELKNQKKPIHKKIQVCKHCHSKWKTKTTCATIWRANDQHHNMEKIQVHWQTIQDNWRMPCWRPQFRCCIVTQRSFL